MDAPSLRFIRADVKVPKERGFDVVTVSWLPTEGWTCASCNRSKCPHLKAVKEALA